MISYALVVVKTSNLVILSLCRVQQEYDFGKEYLLKCASHVQQDYFGIFQPIIFFFEGFVVAVTVVNSVIF